MEVGKLMRNDAALRLPEGSKYQGKLIMPWGFGVVFSNISRAQFDEAELGNVIAAGSVICRDEMTESVDTEAFQKRLWDMFPATFSCQLSLPQIERIRWHLFPQLRIVPPEQVQLFASSQPDKPIAIPDLIKVMDLQQEQLARSMGDGHRVIHGVAGSGKTMILGYRCVEIAKRQGKPVLVLCYNKTLAGRLEHIIHAHGVQDRVSVRHFHGWCGEQLKAYGIKPPPAQPNAQQYLDALVSKGHLEQPSRSRGDTHWMMTIPSKNQR
ncbi:UvrD-helicase domain-containing protein, partial [Xanthomonas populi]|uniref:UvrD-helicase domain-containing protein n=1 Tax=Xanthomonas populi TaxID=53414 RepID=UPI00313458CF